jgi:hypothetical protein
MCYSVSAFNSLTGVLYLSSNVQSMRTFLWENWGYRFIIRVVFLQTSLHGNKVRSLNDNRGNSAILGFEWKLLIVWCQWAHKEKQTRRQDTLSISWMVGQGNCVICEMKVITFFAINAIRIRCSFVCEHALNHRKTNVTLSYLSIHIYLLVLQYFSYLVTWIFTEVCFLHLVKVCSHAWVLEKPHYRKKECFPSVPL